MLPYPPMAAHARKRRLIDRLEVIVSELGNRVGSRSVSRIPRDGDVTQLISSLESSAISDIGCHSKIRPSAKSTNSRKKLLCALQGVGHELRPASADLELAQVLAVPRPVPAPAPRSRSGLSAADAPYLTRSPRPARATEGRATSPARKCPPLRTGATPLFGWGPARCRLALLVPWPQHCVTVMSTAPGSPVAY